MNFNELYRKKDRLRPKRTQEEKRNLLKIVFAGGISMIIGMVVMGIAILIWLLLK